MQNVLVSNVLNAVVIGSSDFPMLKVPVVSDKNWWTGRRDQNKSRILFSKCSLDLKFIFYFTFLSNEQ